MLPNELKEKDKSGRRGTLVRALRTQSSKQLMPESVGDESDETKGDTVKRSTTSDHRYSVAGAADWLANVKHWLGQAVSGGNGCGVIVGDRKKRRRAGFKAYYVGLSIIPATENVRMLSQLGF